MLKNEAFTENQGDKKSDRTRRHMIETSLRSFEKRGYDTCTMRDLAKDAGVTAPAFYYYFSSKEEIVAAFYEDSLKRHLADASHVITDGAPFAKNLKNIIQQRIEEFAAHKNTLAVLKRIAFDQKNQLSPFHSKHHWIRKESIDLFVQLIDKSRLKWPTKTKRELAQIIWLFHLLILFYWIGDESAGHKKTKELLDRSLSHLSTVLFLLRVPGAQRSLSPIFETLKMAGLLENL